MMLPLLDEVQRLVLDLHHEAPDTPLLAFNERQMKRFSALLGFESAVIASGQYEATGRNVSECERIFSMHLHEAPVEKILARQQMQVEDPALAMARQTPGRAVAFTFHREHFRDAGTRAYYDAHGSTHSLACLMPVSLEGHIDVVGLWRGKNRDPYGDRELTLANLLLPHWYMARRHNARFNHVAVGHETPLVILNERGCIEMLTDDARLMLQREWAGPLHGLCPAALWAHITQDVNKPFVGRHLTAQAQRRMGLVEVRLRTPSSLADRPLTPAEWRAAELVAKGMSYKAAAGELAISPATLRNQLHQAYLKLGIKSKGELAANWHRWPDPRAHDLSR